MLLKITHKTSYHYDRPVHYALQQLRLTPKSNSTQKVVDWNISIDGGKKELEFDDQHNNHVAMISIEPGRSDIFIESKGEVETADTSGIIGKHGGFAPIWMFTRATPLTEPGAQVRKLTKTLAGEFETDVERLHVLSTLVADAIAYETGKTLIDTTAEQALEAGHGVCQDHAHAFVSAARLLGYPARYVGGYLMMDDRDHQDAGHAWAEVHVDPIGWIGFDVSNGISPDERYVRVATGLDYLDAAPIAGMRFGDGSESMIVTLQVAQ